MKKKPRRLGARLFSCGGCNHILFLHSANDCGIIRHMIGLTDHQLKIVMDAARAVPVEKRETFLQRIAAMLALRGRGRFTDTDVADVAHLALCGLDTDG